MPAKQEPLRLLGLDPGLADAGWGIISSHGSTMQHVSHGCIRTKADMPLEQRLLFIFQAVQEIIVEFNPSCASIEALFFAKNVSSALPVAHARGVIMLACAQKGIPVFEYTPPQIKQAVLGSGRAEKNQVQEMVRLILGLPTIPKPDHAADALAAAICHGNRASFPGKIPHPALV